MTRRKVKLAWIVSDSARKTSMRKRKQGLIKKVRELTVLCGVHAFVVIFDNEWDRPAIWPCRSTVQQLVQRYNDTPATERSKKTTTQESYLKERIAKVQDQLKKQNKKIQQLVADLIMFQLSRGTQLHELKTDHLIILFLMIEQKINETQKKMEYFKQVPELPSPPPPRFPVNEKRVAVDPANQTENGFTEMDQWFINMMMKTNDVPGSSNASVYGSNASVFGGNASVFGGNGYGGLVINGGTGSGFTNHDGFEVYNWVEPAVQFSQQGSYYNGGQQMNEVDLYEPQEDYGINQLGGPVNGGIEGAGVAVGEGFPRPEIENYGDGYLGGNNVALEFPDEQNHMDFLKDDDGSETSVFLQELFDQTYNDGVDLPLPFDFGNNWDNIFSP